MANVVATYIALDSGCIISDYTHQRLVSCGVRMVRKSRRRSSGLLILLLLVALSFVIANWLGANLSTVIIIVASLAILAMIASIARRRRRRPIPAGNAKAVKRKTSHSHKQKEGIVLGLVIIAVLLLLVATPVKDWLKQNLHTMSLLVTNWFGQNLHTMVTIVLSLAALAVATTLVWINRQKIMQWITSVPKGNGGGICLDDYTWPPSKMRDQQHWDVWQSIINFRCKGQHRSEYEYQIELYEWLNHEFSKDQIRQEVVKGFSRADITIRGIAIELKGPTGNVQLGDALRHIGTLGTNYSLIFFVLFKPEWNEAKFTQFQKDLRRSPHVGVITNSG